MELMGKSGLISFTLEEQTTKNAVMLQSDWLRKDYYIRFATLPKVSTNDGEIKQSI